MSSLFVVYSLEQALALVDAECSADIHTVIQRAASATLENRTRINTGRLPGDASITHHLECEQHHSPSHLTADSGLSPPGTFVLVLLYSI